MNYELKFSMEVIKDLIEIDIDLYRENYDDLKRLSIEELYNHYARHGYGEGRVCHQLSLRENFIYIDNGLNCLEIGPFANPAIVNKNVKYLDVLSTDDLKKRAKEHNLPPGRTPKIDFVSEDGSLNVIKEKFDVIFSSHNIEHQPDLIRHLNEVYDTLNSNGVYKMIVPNCAYCFDAYLAPSKISEIILANYLQLKTHTVAKVIEHRALTVHNDSLEHWKDAFSGKREYKKIDVNRVGESIREFEKAKGDYIDVHSWQFMPHTFSDILNSLIKLNIIRFNGVKCFGPVYGRNEFCVELSK